MTRDHTLRLTLAWAYFVSGLFIIGVAFIPIHWTSQGILGVAGVVALFAVIVLDRAKFTRAYMHRAPSGRVKVLKGVFMASCVLALVPAIIGLALLFQEKPLGDGPRLFPNAMLALFGLYPLICAYLVVAASGRRAHRDGP